MEIQCPHCSGNVDIEESQIGITLCCPICQGHIKISPEVPAEDERKPVPPPLPVNPEQAKQAETLREQAKHTKRAKMVGYGVAIAFVGFLYFGFRVSATQPVRAYFYNGTTDVVQIWVNGKQSDVTLSPKEWKRGMIPKGTSKLKTVTTSGGVVDEREVSIPDDMHSRIHPWVYSIGENTKIVLRKYEAEIGSGHTFKWTVGASAQTSRQGFFLADAASPSDTIIEPWDDLPQEIIKETFSGTEVLYRLEAEE